jgi:GNAT superfamily N-acetyltransferase
MPKEDMIRLATLEDIGPLARLRWEMHVEEGHADVAEEQFVDRFREWAEHAFAERRWQAWVGVVGGDCVGHIYLEVVDKVPRPDDTPCAWGYLTPFYVQQQYRNAGVGGRLLLAAIESARESRLEFVQVWPSKRSRSLYERLGFLSLEGALILPMA